MDSEQLAIKEKRTIEAIKKDLMGASGKLGTICKYLGTPIHHQSTGNIFLDDPYDSPQDRYHNDAILDELLVFDEGQSIHEIGWLFCGLSRGMHLEIKYLDTEKTLTVTHKGFVVYTEVSGDLESYAPNSEWEDMIEKLYKLAKENKKQLSLQEKTERKLLIAEKQIGFLQKMRERWGI